MPNPYNHVYAKDVAFVAVDSVEWKSSKHNLQKASIWTHHVFSKTI